MYLGIDLGTSSIKLILIDENQSIVSESAADLEISHPKPLYSEQNPKDWWDALNQAIECLKKRGEITAIGLSGQMHGAVLLDKAFRVLRPAILWNDGRSFLECKELESKVLNFQQIVGTRMMPGFTAPKLLWIQRHEPEIFAQIAKILLPKDYLRFKMSGDFATDLSDASGTCWLDVGQRKWSEKMVDACNLRIDQLPKTFEGPEVTSKIDPKLALKWGISKETVIIAGGGDNASSAISMGIVQSGSAFISLGTSGVYFVSASEFKPNVEGGLHTFCHCLPNLWHQMSVHLSSAASLSWFKGILRIDDYDTIYQIAKKSSTQLIFLPYLFGIRTPYNDPHAKGVFFGLLSSSSKEEMIRAILEGVAFDFADGQDAILKATEIQEVSVVGGGSKNRLWGEILASVLKQKLLFRKFREVGGALGAAKLAWYAKQKKKDPKVLLKPPELEEIIEPSKKEGEYDKKRDLFKKLYRQLKPCFQEEL